MAGPKTTRRARGRQPLSDRLTEADIEQSFEETLDALDDDVSGIECPPEVIEPGMVVLPSGAVDIDQDDNLASMFPETTSLVTAGGKSKPFTLVKNGLVFDPETTYEAWERSVVGLIEVKKKIDWALADALAWGEDKFGEDDASNVLEGTPFATQTLWNLASIARQIPRELRDDSLPFTVQAEVAPLPYPKQKELIEQAKEKGWKREQMRDEVRKVKREIRREEAESKPVPSVTPPNIRVEVCDARATVWESGSVDCLFTSPPYGIMDEDLGIRKYNVEDDWRDWGQLMDDVADEIYRILKIGGRAIINVPFDTWVGGENGGQRPTYYRLLTALTAAGLTYVTTIHWDEGNISNSKARGSVDSASTPRVITRMEALVVVCKGPFSRLDDMKERGLTNDITHDEWLDWTRGYWQIPGESNGFEGFEAAMPTEVARRAISLYSFKEDTICDPFSGSGTTARVCLGLGRACLASDIDEKMVAKTKRRLLT